jgi:hypothetical protein
MARDGDGPGATYDEAKVHFVEDYATVYDTVEILSSGWVRCGDEPHGPEVFPPHRIDSIDAGYQDG